MGYQPKLGFTVHHGGRVYEAGSTAEDLGDVAYQFGDHVWEDGIKPPAKPTRTLGDEGGDGGGEGGGDPPAPPAGTMAGAPPVPTPSALPSPVANTEGGASLSAEADDGAAAAKTGRGRR